MAKNSIRDYSATASSNTGIQSIDIDENCAASGINNAIREMMADTADFVSGTVGIDVLSLADDDNSAQIKIQAPSAVTTTTTFTLPDGDGDAYQVLKTDGSGTLGWVNVAANPSLIINGAMTISQRGTSFTNLANGQYCLDRFHISKITGGAVDIKQTDDAPTASQAGYLLTKCLHADVTTADASVAASDMYTIKQKIEYKNIAYVGFGQSGTRYVTASFWVKSTKTGTFCCYIKDDNHTRAYTKEYTVSASDTWEYKALTFPVDTSSTSVWNGTSTDTGAELGWTLYSGTDYHITADTWTTTSNNYAPCTSNQVNALDSASNDFKITGVKLEIGSTATDFFHRSYGEELALCQRYFQYFPSGALGRWTNSTLCEIANAFPVRMRAVPTNSINPNDNTAFIFRVGISVNACTISGVNSVYMAETGGIVQTTVSSTASTPSAGDVAAYDTNGDSNVIFCDAEL